MLEPTSVDAQLDATRADRLRVLVVGAGVAGVTLAQLLRRDGLHPVLVERSAEAKDAGYMLALMPLVDPVLDDLDLRAEYLDRTVPLDRYVIRSSTGATNREYSIAGLLEGFGDYRGISRGELLRLLGSTGGAVSYGTTVTALDQPATGDHVEATLRTGETSTVAEFDVVVVADGLRSATRELLLPASRVARIDTGWGGWVAWAEPPAGAETLGEELWGAGFFVGVYPVPGRVGVIVAGRHDETAAGPAAFVAGVRRRLRHVDTRLDSALTAVTDADSPYYWSLTDCRVDAWAHDRVVLVGDAAVGFLPTAGIGACMAMESVWALGARLRTTTPDRVASTLTDFERAQRPRVEAAQDNSRGLARLMFHRSRALAKVRDVAARVVPMQTALRPIRKLLRTAPTARAAGGARRPGHARAHPAARR